MMSLIKKIIFICLLNGTFFFLLIIGIQNSDQKNKINLFNNESIELPVSFIVGLSFISGSLTGNLFLKNLFFKEK